MTKYSRNNAPETVLRIRKIQFFAKNGLHLKLTHIKAQKMILSGRYGDPYGRPGDWCRIRESWHVCKFLHCQLCYEVCISPKAGRDTKSFLLGGREVVVEG